jgi:hypothetical protein
VLADWLIAARYYLRGKQNNRLSQTPGATRSHGRLLNEEAIGI